MMASSRSDNEEECPLLIEQGLYLSGQRRKSQTLDSKWARFRQPSPIWIICVFIIYEFIFGILTVPEFNATFALICHQRYSAGQARPRNSLYSRDLSKELELCLANKQAQSELSRFLIYGQVTAGFLSAFSAPILCSLSDRVGRKPILACATIGPLLYEALMVLVLRYPDSIDIHWLLVGYALEGLSGTVITATATSQTYITDVTHSNACAGWFSYLQAAFSFAGAAGPVISGILLSKSNPFIRTYTLAVGAHISLLLVFLFVLPESRISDPGYSHRDGSTPERPPSEDYVLPVLKSIKSTWGSKAFRQKNVIILALMEMIMFGNMIGLPPLLLAYSAFLFEWLPTTQSFFMSLSHSWSIAVLVLIFPLTMKHFRQWKRRDHMPNQSTAFNVGELGAIQANLILQMLGYMGTALATAPSHFIISTIIVCSASSIAPLLTSCLTRQIPSHQSAQLLGFTSFLHAISRIVIPAFLNGTYSMTVGNFPAPLFVLLSIIIGGLLVASMCLEKNRR